METLNRTNLATIIDDIVNYVYARRMWSEDDLC